jgi:hypothetical protein
MAVEYRVYDPQTNEFLRSSEDESQAIADAEALASVDQLVGVLEVHKITDGDLVTAAVVHRVQA